MGWLEDSVDEFRKLPPAGKIALGAAGVGVAVLAYVQFRNSQNSAANTAAQDAANQAALGGLTLSGGTGGFSSNAPAAPSSPVSTGGTGATPFAPIWPIGRIDSRPFIRLGGNPDSKQVGPREFVVGGLANMSAPPIWEQRARQTITISAGVS